MRLPSAQYPPARRRQVKAVRGLDELRRDSYFLSLLAHAAFQNGAHVQLLAYRSQVPSLSLELEGRCHGSDPEFLNPGQIVEQFLGQAIGKVLLFPVGTHVHKWKHCDGRPGWPGRW